MEENAVARYSLFINFSKLFQLIEVFIGVVLISWSSSRLPSVLKISGEHLVAFSSNLLNQHVVFFVGNVIIVICYVLSRDNHSGYESGKFNEKQSFTSDPKIAGDTSIGELTPPVKVTEEMKETTIEENRNERVCYENAIVKTTSDVAVETAIKQAAKQIDWFSRTQSEKLKREISIRPQQELRRSETATATATERSSNMLVTTCSTAVSFEKVEKLSNEEFQVAVETFISKHQSFLKQQSMAENGIKF